MIVAPGPRQTIRCQECGGWNTRWSSEYAGDTVENQHGDLMIWCRDCSKLYDILLTNLPKSYTKESVRVSADELDWSDRSIWFHAGAEDWWRECPSDVNVHVGRAETSMWLSGVMNYGSSVIRYKLFKVSVDLDYVRSLGDLTYDIGDGWLDQSTAYLNAYEYPGSVSLYIPKSKLKYISSREIK